MSGDVFNLTVDHCTFGTDGSDYAGIHLKARLHPPLRPRLPLARSPAHSFTTRPFVRSLTRSPTHSQSERGRGGSVHDVRLTNLVFHSETSVKQKSPLSASLYVPPCVFNCSVRACEQYRVLFDSAPLFQFCETRSTMLSSQPHPQRHGICFTLLVRCPQTLYLWALLATMVTSPWPQLPSQWPPR